jgi:hypothetical protein
MQTGIRAKGIYWCIIISRNIPSIETVPLFEAIKIGIQKTYLVIINL